MTVANGGSTTFSGNDLVLFNANGATALNNSAGETWIFSTQPISLYPSGTKVLCATSTGVCILGQINTTGNITAQGQINTGSATYHQYQIGSDATAPGFFIFDSQAGCYMMNINNLTYKTTFKADLQAGGNINVCGNIIAGMGTNFISVGNGSQLNARLNATGSMNNALTATVDFGTLGSYIGYDYTGNEYMIYNARYACSQHQWRIAGTNKMTLDANGNVVAMGEIKSCGAGAGMTFQNRSGTELYEWYATSNCARLYHSGVGADRLSVDCSGNVVAVGDVTSFSDKRLKTDIQVINQNLKSIENICGYYYKRCDNQDNRCNVGLIAQEIQCSYPQLVRNNEGTLSLNYQGFTAVLLNSIKELKQLVDKQDLNIFKLENCINNIIKHS
jgi:hypothetical protein